MHPYHEQAASVPADARGYVTKLYGPILEMRERS
jgi:hypothetical protein